MGNKLKHIIGILAGIVCFVIYILTLHPAVTFIDSGELAAACYTFGVPHPTGYPIFLLLGYIVSHLPLQGSVIYRLNLLSAIESAAAVIVTYYSAIILCKYVLGKLSIVKIPRQIDKKLKKTVKPDTEIHPVKRSIEEFNIIFYILGFITAVSMGLTKTFWFNAIQIEVYALHSLFISILIYYSLKILTGLKEPEKKNWVILFTVFGLALANHLTVIFFIPALLFMLYMQYSSDNNFTKKILPYGLLILPGILLYYILVISSSSVPYLNWSDLENISNLPGHLSGSDFSQLMFSSSSKFSDNAASFIKNLPGEFAIIPLIFSAAGFILLWRTFLNFIIYISLSVIFTLFYSFNYNIIDISTYYLLAFYLISLTVPVGILFIISLGKPAGILNGKNEPGLTRNKVIMAGLILVIFSAVYNYKESDNSTNYANVDYTLNALNSLPQNSILIVYEWSYIYSASLYYQLVEKVRPDVKVINVKFLSVPWYLKMINKYYPEIYELIKTEVQDYEKTLGLSEKERAPKLSALVSAFIDNCSVKFPFYVSVDLILSKDMKQFITGYTIKPIGTVYKLDKKNMPYDPTSGVNTLDYSYRKFDQSSKQKSTMFKVIPGMLFETGYYHYNNKNFELSLKFLDKALEFDPTFRDALNLKSKIASQK